MSTPLNVVTGATGLLGSHLVEHLVERSQRVRVLVREGSDTKYLQHLGVELAYCDFAQPDRIQPHLAGGDVVYHCAARVGDWGPWRGFVEQVNLTRQVLEACRRENVGRVIHISSIQVYGHPEFTGKLFDEQEPLGQNLGRWEYYARSKILAEEVCRQYPGALTILRPSWIYGPRDRNSLPRLFKGIQAGRVCLLGKGDKLLNLVYAGDVAEAAILAAQNPRAAGQVYNLSSSGEITHREFLDAITDFLGIPKIRRGLPVRLAYLGGWFSEMIGHAIFIKRPPHVTRYGVGLIARSTNFSTEKARRELGWEMKMPALVGLRLALEWQRSQGWGDPQPVKK